GLQSRSAQGVRLAVQLLPRHLDRHRSHPPAARKARARSCPSAVHPDGVGNRIPVRAVKRSAIRVALAVFVAAGASAIAWPVYGRAAFFECVAILAPLGAATTLLAGAVASHRAR